MDKDKLTYQEALDWLYGTSNLLIKTSCRNKLQELIEKEKPKKCTKEKLENNDNYYCPNCQENVTFHYWRPNDYCLFCGQRLDW